MRPQDRTNGLHARAVLAGALFVAISLVAAPAALADHALERFVGGPSGSGAGQFNTPAGPAVDESTGQLYVVDNNNNRIQRFNADGDFELMWGRGVSSGHSAAPAEVCAAADGSCSTGFPGSSEGMFHQPRYVGINQANGHLYVYDGSNRRIQEFSFDDSGTSGDPSDDVPVFVRAWGWSVIQPGGPGDVVVNEEQRITVDATGGSFRLAYPTPENVTAAVPFDATPGQIDAALEGLADLGPGAVSVSGPAGGPWTVEFVGPLGDRDTKEITLMGSHREADLGNNTWVAEDLTGGARTIAFETLVEGGSFEVCIEQCKEASSADRGEPGMLGGSKGLGVTGNGIAVSPVDGDVFVATTGDRRMQRFNPDGTIDPEPISGGAFEVGAVPAPIAIDSSGIVYAGNRSNSGQIERYDSTGIHSGGSPGFLSPLPSPPLLPGTTGLTTVGLAVDRDSDGSGPDVDRLYVLRNPDSGDTVVQQFDQPGEQTPPAEVTASHGAEVFGTAWGNGLAHDSSTDSLYFTSSVGAAGHGLFIIRPGASGFEFSASLDDPPSSVGANSVQASGTIDPGNGSVSYRFEYSKDGGEWTSGPEGELEGPDPAVVSAEVKGLEPNSPYRLRLTVDKVAGPDSIATEASNQVLFATPAVPPGARTLHPLSRSDTTARIGGLVNPNNLPSTYYLEWGESTAYGNRLPVPDGVAGDDFGDRLVAEELSGLEADTTYHYRVVAENSEGQTLGDDVSFNTRASKPEGGRGWEMVTPPFKITRSTVLHGGPPGRDANPGFASLSGDRVRWNISYFPLVPETGSPMDGDNLIIRRTPSGWVTKPLMTLPILPEYPSVFVRANVDSASGDLETQAWKLNATRSEGAALLPNEGDGPLELYTRRDGSGTEGFTGWLRNVDTQALDQSSDQSLFNDDGTAMARWGRYRGLAEDPATPGDEDPSDNQQLAGQSGGSTAYIQRAGDPAELPAAAKELVSECSGVSGGGSDPASLPTLLPSRVGTGTATDTIGTRECGAGNVTSVRGAAVGANSAKSSGLYRGPAATALSQDGRWVFFTSPDSSAPLPSGCASTTGAATNCPPQLFVRQYDSGGRPIVRWISRAQGTGPQQIGLMGRGAVFEGASEDGRYVYFKSNAPLTADDPNGSGGSGPVATGTASNASWDLFRYELPVDLDADPGAGTLIRVSAGPDAAADPNTNPFNGGEGTAARFISNDGRRAYFVTGAPIAGADSTPPKGGVTTPGGSVGDNQDRNLYLFDDTKTGAERWRFVARLPFHGKAGLGTSCATFEQLPGFNAGFNGFGSVRGVNISSGSCVRGTSDGGAIAFSTPGRLTMDDDDDAIDIYLYDADADELARVTSSPLDPASYVCNSNQLELKSFGVEEVHCNGHFGYSPVRYPSSLDLSRGWGGARQLNISEDASGAVSVYFESRASLLGGDENEGAWDVYQWREGRLSLISGGRPGHHSYYSGNSLDGRDIFISTTERIDPRELDDADYDIYDYRIGGGFPYLPPPTPCDVLALDCENSASPSPPARSGATSGFAGSGNVTPTRRRARGCGKAKLRRGKHCVSKRALARKRCRKARGRAKRRCLRRQTRRLTRIQRHQLRKQRAAQRGEARR